MNKKSERVKKLQKGHKKRTGKGHTNCEQE